MIREAKVTLRSISAYSQSIALISKKGPNESHEDHDERVWREKLSVTSDGMVYIPAMAFKKSLIGASKWLRMTIPGKGKSTYTKRFEAGIMVVENMGLGIHRDDVACERLFVPSDGVVGGGKRVFKTFPLIPSWEGEITYTVLDDMIPESVLKEHIAQAGMFVGVGRFRPSSQSAGTYGRYEIVKFEMV